MEKSGEIHIIAGFCSTVKNSLFVIFTAG